VNFGVEAVPLDKWFGSFHDGSPEAHAAMLEQRKKKTPKMSI
jgi:lathosterol oxidase